MEEYRVISQQENHRSSRKRTTQQITVPFLWEVKPGTPKKIVQPSRPPPPPPQTQTQTQPTKLVVSVPFKWEDKPGTPLRTRTLSPGAAEQEQITHGRRFDDDDDDERDWLWELDNLALSIRAAELDQSSSSCLLAGNYLFDHHPPLDSVCSNKTTPGDQDFFNMQQLGSVKCFIGETNPLTLGELIKLTRGTSLKVIGSGFRQRPTRCIICDKDKEGTDEEPKSPGCVGIFGAASKFGGISKLLGRKRSASLFAR